MIPQKDLEKQQVIFMGPITPVGIRQKHSFPIFIDESALQLETMIVSAGEIGHSIQIKPQLLADFVQADFCRYFRIMTEKETRLWNYILFDTDGQNGMKKGRFQGSNGDSPLLPALYSSA